MNSTLSCRYEKGERFRLSHGQAGLVLPGVRHRFVVGEKAIDSTWCHVRFTVYETVDLFSLFAFPEVWSGEAAERLRQHCADMIRAARTEPERPLLRRARVESAALAWLGDVLTEAKPLPRQSEVAAGLERLSPALQRIRHGLAEPLTLEELTHSAAMSRSRFTDLFVRTLGMSPLRYVKHLRLQRAQILLRSTRDPVAEIGAACGYPDAFHFSRTFKAETGLSPRAFRLQQGGGMF